MWLRPLTERGRSKETLLNFLWQADDRPLYLMDNHRAALWCWRRHLESNEAYSLGHVDYHWDARAVHPADLQLLRREWDDLDELKRYDDLGSTTRSDDLGGRVPLICWDNYFDALLHLYPRVHELRMAVHQPREVMGGMLRVLHDRHEQDLRTARARTGKLGPILSLLSPWKRPAAPAFHFHSPVRFFEELDEALHDAEVPFILNIDLDYFFAIGSDENETVQRAFELQFITDCFRTVARHRDRLRVVTIALSPECCGGWVAAEVACLAAFEGLGIPYPLAAAPT
jgi:hypothetical protein